MTEGNCSRHSDTPAIAKCEKCGAGMCLECIEEVEKLNTECTQNICLDCYKEELKEYIAKGYKTSSDILSGLFKLLLFFGGIGIIAFGSVMVSSSLWYILVILLGIAVLLGGSFTLGVMFFEEGFDTIGLLIFIIVFNALVQLFIYPVVGVKEVVCGIAEKKKRKNAYKLACDKLNKLEKR